MVEHAAWNTWPSPLRVVEQVPSLRYLVVREGNAAE